MARITRFEDIEAWQKARELALTVYRLASAGAFSRDFALRDQICRAAGSPMANIAEGFAGDGDREFQQCLSVAKGSCAEVQSQLYLAHDLGYVNDQQFEHAYRLVE